MSSRANFKTKCVCGGDIQFDIKKPTRFQPALTKVSCPSCRSRYFMTCEIDRNQPGRVFKVSADLIELTSPAKDAARAVSA